MFKYFKRKSPLQGDDNPCSTSTIQSQQEINLEDLSADPGNRIRIVDYHPNIRDQVRRAYLQRGPCQPRNHNFPLTKYGQQRRFNQDWFDEFPWLEYSISKDAAYCFCCYLFKNDIGGQGRSDHFVNEGFSNWKKREKLFIHVGGANSSHNKAWGKCEDLMNQKRHIETSIHKQTNEARANYRKCLTATIEAVRYLSLQSLAFRGHDESEDSSNPGNFIQLLRTFGRISSDVDAVTLRNAPKNQQLIASQIQKEIVSACAMEVVNVIISDLGDAPFSLLVDEARDMSVKEQMAIVIRYVHDKGNVIERFLGVEHVTDTSAHTLKSTIDDMLCRYGLSMSRLPGQGYDGASNMRGQFNGLKSLIMKENPCAYYVHCFAHQLQLALVAVARNHNHISSLFVFISGLLSLVGSSCKHRDMLREKQAEKVAEALDNGELSSGRGLNQETSLKRSGDTRWGSHYRTLLSLFHMFDAVVDVLEFIGEDAKLDVHRTEARNKVERLLSFDFVFSLFLMRKILAITNELSEALQSKDQDIVNAMALVKLSEDRLQVVRESGWTSLLDDVSSFCESHGIVFLDMNGVYLARGQRRRRGEEEMTNLYHYRVETFYTVIDMQLQELNARFTESNTELLLCVACLHPVNAFIHFNKDRLIQFASFYPKDFTSFDVWKLEDQLDAYIADMHSSVGFSKLTSIGELAQKMVECGKNKLYPQVYLLLTLALTLPVATATVERVFSAMNAIKTKWRNRLSDEWLSDSLILFVEKDIFEDVSVETIMERFQNMKTRRGCL